MAAHTLTAIVRAFGGKTHAARTLLSKCISGILPSCMNIAKATTGQNAAAVAGRADLDPTGKVAQNTIQLVIACFDVIAKEMGEDLITASVKEFVEMYSSPRAVTSLSVDTGASLMELLTLLARRPGAKFKALSMQVSQSSSPLFCSLSSLSLRFSLSLHSFALRSEKTRKMPGEATK